MINTMTERAVNQHRDGECRKDREQRVECDTRRDERGVVLSQLLPHAQQYVAPARSWKLGRVARMPAAAGLETVTSDPSHLSGQLCVG
jgi:hypothetical protein